MDNTKSAFASTGVWGSAVALFGALAPSLLGAAGLKSPTDQQTLISTGAQVVTGLGAVVALYGRLRATKRIG